VVLALRIGALRGLVVAVGVSLPSVAIAYLIAGTWVLRRRPRAKLWLAIATLGFLGPTPLLLSLAILGAFPEGLQGTLPTIVIAMSAVAWPPLVLRLRNELQHLEQEPFVQAARREGAGDWAVLVQEMLPTARPVLEGLVILSAIGAIAGEATIGYVGAGVMPVDESLGRMLKWVSDACTEPHSRWQGVVMLASVGGVLAVVIGGLGLLQQWLEDRRVARAIVEPKLGSTHGQTGERAGWTATVWHRRTGKVLVREAFVPYLPGRITVISGPSGSAKSLTASSLAGQLPYSLRSRVRRPHHHLTIHLLPQGLQENFAAGLDVADYLRGSGCPQPETESVLAQVGLSRSQLSVADGSWKRPLELSGGMAQRLGIALVLRKNPDVLVMDEPISALDDINARRVGRLLRRLAEERPSLAIIVINHRAEWTRLFGDHVVFLSGGRSVCDLPKNEFFAARWSHSDSDLSAYLSASGRLNAPAAVAGGEDASIVAADRSCGITSREESSVVVDSVTVRHESACEPVVSDLSFSARKGECLAIQAPSGGGKTTVLQLLNGQFRAERGTVRVLGREPSPVRQDVRLCAQSPGLVLNPCVTIETTLTRAWRRLGLSGSGEPRQEAIRRAASQAGLPLDALAKRPAELSGGLRVRAGLAKTLLGSPQVILADEVTAGLDPEVAIQVLDALRRLLDKQRLTVILATHERNHAAYIGARAVTIGGHSEPPHAVAL
jgi:ABC-type glutathione transport system ATPase component/ABC-type dipeptide/oligopeptide/nickel transport system permease subunit